MSEYYYEDLIAATKALKNSDMLSLKEFINLFKDVGIELLDDDLMNITAFYNQETK